MSPINMTLAQIQELELNTILPMLMLACLGLLLSMLAIARLIRGKIMVASVHGISGILLLGTGISLLAVALNIHTYQRLIYEQEIARLTFRQMAPQKYNVSIIYNSKDDKQEFLLEGDEWQMDARIMRWSPNAQLLGLNAQYRLERLSGRYQDLHLEQTLKRTVYSLSKSAGLDIWSLAKRYKNWLPWIDAYYGSAVYLPMIDGGGFSVSINQNGMIARPVNAPAEQILQIWK